MKIVKGCKTCPFLARYIDADLRECNLDGGVTPKRGTPPWCPLLRLGPITIVHRKDTRP